MHTTPRRKQKLSLKAALASLILLVLIGITIKATWNIYGKERETRAKLEEVSAEHEDLASRQRELTEKIEGLETPIGTEREIRSKFQVAREGEELVIIKEEALEEEEMAPESEKSTFWERVKSTLHF